MKVNNKKSFLNYYRKFQSISTLIYRHFSTSPSTTFFFLNLGYYSIYMSGRSGTFRFSVYYAEYYSISQFFLMFTGFSVLLMSVLLLISNLKIRNKIKSKIVSKLETKLDLISIISYIVIISLCLLGVIAYELMQLMSL